MSNKELDELKREIERHIDNAVEYSEYEKLRESVVHIEKMQRPEPWPDPAETETTDDKE